MRGLLYIGWLIAASFAASTFEGAESPTGKIVKVLPHYLDAEGRHTLSPSLYERDAYQARLRERPELCAGLRFDVQWKASGDAGRELVLRVEIKGSESHIDDPLVVDARVKKRRWFSRWSRIELEPEDFKALGKIVAWRVTLLDGGEAIGEQKSFLW